VPRRSTLAAVHAKRVTAKKIIRLSVPDQSEVILGQRFMENEKLPFQSTDRGSSDSETADGESLDRESFVRLLMRHDRTIRAFLRGLLPTANDVDEVMQEVSVVAWRKFGQLDDPENFRRWVSVIARYEVLMYRRKKARDRFVLGTEVENLLIKEAIDEIDLREDQLNALQNCLAKMPADRKSLVMLIYSTETPMKQIAKRIGKTPEALYKFISRARRELMECVESGLAEVNP
jgi:RNA polymerase sigma-70 factor (ECF subfamily)